MKNAKRFLALSLVVLMALALTACGGSKVEGTWKLSGGSAMGAIADGVDSMEMMEQLGFSILFIYREKGEFEMSMSAMGQTQAQKGTWSEDDGNLTMVIEGDPLTAKYSVKGDKLTLTVDQDGVSGTLEFTKAK